MSTAGGQRKRVVLSAHPGQIGELAAWATFHQDMLARCEVYVAEASYQTMLPTLKVNLINFSNGWLSDRSGPSFDLLVFLWNVSPVSDTSPHKLLLDAAIQQNIPIAANRAAADFIFPAYLLDE